VQDGRQGRASVRHQQTYPAAVVTGCDCGESKVALLQHVYLENHRAD